jgi:hypothetical protein
MEVWKFKVRDLITDDVLEEVEAEVDDYYGILWGLEEAAKKVEFDAQERFPAALTDCDPDEAVHVWTPKWWYGKQKEE